MGHISAPHVAHWNRAHCSADTGAGCEPAAADPADGFNSATGFSLNPALKWRHALLHHFPVTNKLRTISERLTPYFSENIKASQPEKADWKPLQDNSKLRTVTAMAGQVTAKLRSFSATVS